MLVEGNRVISFKILNTDGTLDYRASAVTKARDVRIVILPEADFGSVGFR